MPETTLKLIHIIFRHGDRTPDKHFQYPTDPYIRHEFAPFGDGQLTNIGRKTMYDLGLSLRTTYNDYLGDLYMPKYVDGLSTDTDRTKVSMQLVLTSLFPAKGENVWCDGLNWQPIPFKTNRLIDDDILAPLALRPEFHSAYNRLFEDGEGADFLKTHQKTFDYLRNHTGQDFKNARACWLLTTVLSAEQEFGLPLPDWTKEVYPEKLLELSVAEYHMQTATKELRKIVHGKLMRKILMDSRAKLSGQSECKIHLYSGHDFNVASVLGFFGLMFPHFPAYGSCIVLEVHDEKGKCFLKSRYKESKTSNLKYTIFPSGTDTLSLEKFEIMVEDLFN